MDSFFLPLVTAALAEWGDKTQILALLLAAHFRKPVVVLIGISCAAIASSIIAAFGGSLIAGLINEQAASLFLVLGFAFAGIGAFIPFRDPEQDYSWKLGAFLSSVFTFFVLELGDKTQFLTAGYAATHPTWQFVAAGAAIGTILACAPAIMMGEALREQVSLKLIRRIAGGLFLLVAAILAINSFSLI